MTQQTRRDKQKMAVILGAGFLLRLFYVLFSTIYDRQYDIGTIDLDAGGIVSGGHLAYIQYLYENWHLPDFDPTTVYQFNHPPLHHFTCAVWMKFCSLFIHDTAVLEESIQAVPFVCSLLSLIVLLKIVSRFELQAKTQRFLMLLFAFHPALVLLSGSVNNDCMSLLFTLLCVDTAIVWSRRPTMGNILKIALSIALGMLTKQNVAEMAFPVGAVFLYVWYRENKKAGGFVRLLKQFVCFGLVSVPLGMSFYLHNMMVHGMPLVWVYELEENSWQYTGNVPVLNRFLWPIPSEMVDNLKNFRLGCGYNVWMQIIRTSVLGEWDMADVGKMVKVLAVLLMLVGAFLAFAALLAFGYVFAARRKKFMTASGLRLDWPCWLLFVIGYLVNMAFYLKFAYDYPQQCSMHFRYIEITLLFPAVALGIARQERLGRWTKLLLDAALLVFCALSVAMIGVWCLG